MAMEANDHRFPAGTGWVVGYIVGAVLGIIGWILSSDVVIGLIVLAGTSPALGAALEQSLDTRPLTAIQRRYVQMLAVAGVVVGLIVLVFVVLI